VLKKIEFFGDVEPRWLETVLECCAFVTLVSTCQSTWREVAEK